MPLTTTRRELKSFSLCLIPNGTSVDGGTVSSSAWPDASPTTNYTDWKWADIEKAEDFREVDSEEFLVPDDAGGYEKQEEQMTLRRGWIFTTSKTNHLIKQLTENLAAPPVVGTAQAPNSKKDNSLVAVALIEQRTKDAGAIVERHQVWVELRLVNIPGADGKTGKIGYRLQILRNSLNSYLLVA